MKPYAFVLTHDRHMLVRQLVHQLYQDGIEVFVIDHNSTPAVQFDLPGVYVARITDFVGEDFNISQLWNIGLNWVNDFHLHSGRRDEEFCVTVFNDDAFPSPVFCHSMATIMETTGVDIVSPSVSVRDCVIVGPPRQIPLWLRPAGWCWTVRGSSGIRADESMKIWYSDDDLWQQALAGRGYALTTQETCANRDADGNFSRNAWWQEQAGRDRQTFVEKHGRQPW